MELAGTNARNALEDRVTALAYVGDRADEVLFELQDRLDLKVVPRLMVCFDISHIQGSDTVGSVVVFENGAPKKAGYRHMKIRGEWGNDDYRSMAEVVSRYFSRRLRGGRTSPGPGGHRRREGPAERRPGASRGAWVFLRWPWRPWRRRRRRCSWRDRPDPVVLHSRDRALHLLQRIRDEAHRFAITYNRKLRSKRTLRSQLGEIPGVGPGRQKALLSHFGSVRAIRDADPEEIARLPGIGLDLALRILTYLEGVSYDFYVSRLWFDVHTVGI